MNKLFALNVFWQGVALGASLMPGTSISLTDRTEALSRWENGYLTKIAGQDTPALTVLTFDQTGRKLSENLVRVEGATEILVAGFTRFTDGRTLICGQARSTNNQFASFFSVTSADGTSHKIVQTAPFTPRLVSSVPDGTFWTVGYEAVDGNVKAPGVNNSAPVLRHYDSNFQLMGSAIAQSAVGMVRLAGVGLLVATPGWAGWYSGAGLNSGSPQYIEINSDGSVRRFPGVSVPDQAGLPQGIAAIGDTVYVAVGHLSGSKIKTTLYTLDREASSWVPIVSTTVGRENFRLLGGGDSGLVFNSATGFITARPQ